MARGIKTSAEEKIEKQEKRVAELKERYEKELAILKSLEEEAKKDKLLKFIETSGKSADEIMKLLEK